MRVKMTAEAFRPTADSRQQLEPPDLLEQTATLRWRAYALQEQQL
jgi:hypothetical protein